MYSRRFREQYSMAKYIVLGESVEDEDGVRDEEEDDEADAANDEAVNGTKGIDVGVEGEAEEDVFHLDAPATLRDAFLSFSVGDGCGATTSRSSHDAFPFHRRGGESDGEVEEVVVTAIVRERPCRVLAGSISVSTFFSSSSSSSPLDTFFSMRLPSTADWCLEE